MKIDINRFKETFFQEADEHVAAMESGLLALEAGAAGQEALNATFRAIHSIKGSAGLFDLEALGLFAHAVETLLDQLRAGAVPADQERLDLLLESVDVLRGLLAAARQGQPGPAQDTAALRARIVAASQGSEGAPQAGPADPVVLATVLGSCVAVCLFDPQRGVGGMNHFLLPGGETDRGRLTRFGAHAMEMLINEVMRIGGERHRLLAKVFGGGHVLPGITTQDVGGQNAMFALEFLKRESIPVVSQLLQLRQPLEVRFFPQSGRAMVRRLAVQATQSVAASETRYQRVLKAQLQTDSGGDVTLF